MTRQLLCARCRRCGLVLPTVGELPKEEALRVLRDHVRAVHPDAQLRADVYAGVVLRHFDIARADAL